MATRNRLGAENQRPPPPTRAPRAKVTYLCVRERDKRLELVTTRLALPQVLYAMPIQISRPIWQEHGLPAARHSLVRHGDLQSETAMTLVHHLKLGGSAWRPA